MELFNVVPYSTDFKHTEEGKLASMLFSDTPGHHLPSVIYSETLAPSV